MARDRKPRVYHAPFDVGGNAYYLSRAERERGFISKTFVYFRQWFGYPIDRDLKVGAGGNPFWSIRWWFGLAEILFRADVVHFNFGTSLLSDLNRKWIMADLPLLNAVGISTFVTFQGCDSRISDFAIENFQVNACANCRSRLLCESSYNDYKREMINAALAWMDGVYAVNPDLLHNIPGAQFLPYSNCDTRAWVPPPDDRPDSGRRLRVLHAPTWREIKGSDFVIAAVKELEAEGENVELVLVENVPHAEVRRVYETADLLVDQVLVGWYGGLAVELMALGKPVVAFLRENDLELIPVEMREDLPVISATPETLKETLRGLIRDRAGLRLRGKRSRAFVEKWHAPERVAEFTTAAYRKAIAVRGGPVKIGTRLRRLGRYFGFYARFGLRTLASIWRSRLYHLAWRSGPLIVAALAVLAAPLIWANTFWRLYIVARPASVWGTTPILTLPLLAEADRLLGCRSKTLAYTTYYITSQFDYVLKAQIEWLVKRLPFLIPVFRRLVFAWALIRFDVFHFFYDEGIIERDGRFGVSENELKWLRRFGKRLYLYAYGADVRTKKETEALGKFNCCTHCDRPGINCLCDSEAGARNMEKFSKYATQLVSMGDMMAYTPGARRLWYWPIDLSKLSYVGVAAEHGGRPLRIFHAPNHSWAKGSQYLKAAVDKLRSEGIAIELDTVSGVPNDVVVSRMADCDMVVDQLLIGWHGYTALESMARGKPVVCYIRDRAELVDADFCPIISANPDTIEQVLRELAERPRAELADLGRRSREYVERNYSVSAVAVRLGELYVETAKFPRRVESAIGGRKSGLRVDRHTSVTEQLA
ncbi:glycosyltransferase [Bradyrhizobium elkanii]|uniref:glycosyltransferase n=1 Tax=Bradyrhizobium elkanii TaxID=29448 RepID=UPI001AE2A4EE|nr:glycosyltransferase [Bradyrhizobium elkanii]MBP2434213.1 glycosyltransferase involved in cell wall biosynthesis [Bradyrhizobium elkanii]WLA88876.1 glycosyltransferase [Bradyrhizobium elkanii]